MLLFCDLETTGLCPQNDAILEVACALVDNDNMIVRRHESLVKHRIIPSMHNGVREMHTDNGLLVDLIDNARDSIMSVDINLARRMRQWMEWFEIKHFTLAGNSIHFDRSFIKHYMPCVEQKLHYRMVDVSSIKILFQRAKANLPPEVPPAHRAMADVLESIESYKFFQREVEK
jgi:oligoribonuclease